MKLATTISASDLMTLPLTPLEQFIALLDKKSSYFRDAEIDKSLFSLKESGVDGFELLIPHHTDMRHIKKLKILIEHQDINIFSIHQPLSNPGGLNLDKVEKLCRIASIFSARVVVLHSSTLKNYLLDIEFTNKLKILEKKYSMTFGIENMTRNIMSQKSFTYNGKEFAKVVRIAGLRITFDTTHLGQAGGDILGFYDENKDIIVNLHISDYKHTVISDHLIPQFSSHLPINHGDLPLMKLISKIKKDNYSGQITMEINSNFKDICTSARIISQSPKNV